jgi:cytochrome aa3-600 menaquinol oxidase subunit 2
MRFSVMKKERFFEMATLAFSIVILTILGVLSFQYMISIDYGKYFSPNTQPEVIKVIAKQYVWEFIYPNGTVSIDKVTIQAGKPYIFELTSMDVIHAFYIVQLGYKFEAIPGYNYSLPIQINQPGVYDIFCAEFCGPGHYAMIGTLQVVNASR